jgi:ethanolamine utilization protein EutN
MFLARVAGTVVATQKNSQLVSQKILVVQPINLHKADEGVSVLAVDRVNAGVGDIVLVHKEGGGVRILYQNKEIPLQLLIVAVVDNFDFIDEEL